MCQPGHAPSRLHQLALHASTVANVRPSGYVEGDRQSPVPEGFCHAHRIPPCPGASRRGVLDFRARPGRAPQAAGAASSRRRCRRSRRSIREAVADAQRLQAAGSNARAAERLRSAIRLLDDPILPKKNVDAWRTQLTAGIRSAESRPVRSRGHGSDQPAQGSGGRRVKAMIEEDKEIRRGVDTVGSLIKAGDVAQAKKEVEALSKKFPTNPTVLVLPNLVAKTMTLDEVKDVHAKQIENIRLALVDLQKSATMAKIDYELPADWKEKTERRKPQLNPKLKAVLAALRTPVEIDKSNAPLVGGAQGAVARR